MIIEQIVACALTANLARVHAFFYKKGHSTKSFLILLRFQCWKFLIWFLKFLYCRKDNSKSCSGILYQTPALKFISFTQGSKLRNNHVMYEIIDMWKLKKFCHTGSVYKNLMERYFTSKISFLIFRRPKNLVLKIS